LITAKGSEWIFRTQVVSARSYRGITDFAIDYLKSKKIAVWNDTGEMGRAAAEEALKKLKEKGITPLAHLTHHAKDKDFTPQLMKIKKLGVETVIAPFYYGEAAIILKQREDLGIDFQIVASDVLSTPAFLDLAGELANGVYVSLLFSVDDPDPSAQAFIKAYTEKYDTRPDSLAAMGYDAPYIVWDAITRAGSLDKTKIRDALRTSSWKGVCGQTEFSPNGDDIKPFLITQIRDGKYIPITRMKGM
jgi:branched-chain amino acid transport system substrate-binding protein